MPLDYLANAGTNILFDVATLVLVSLGLSIVFGMMGVINMAHGEFIMIGAFTVVLAVRQGVPLWAAMVAGPVVTGLVGVVTERLLIRRLYGKRIEGTLLATFGLGLILQQGATLLLGSSPEGIATPLGSFSLGRYSIGWYSLVIVAAALALVGLVLLLFLRTRYGLLARATMQNRAMAANLGIDTSRINMLTFGLGSALAGAAGALLAPVVAVVPTMGIPLISSAFITVVLGGPAVVTGTAASAGLLGLVRQVVTLLSTPLLGTAALLVAATVILRLLPGGISGRYRRTTL
ncbi:urea ABC transporter permease subunit UrtB [Nonomuraea sp. NEAU-A123]|uniref:ABC transporter permease subunit n=1 Tax=Nonomuraea sp. NEAU-A123 TaxID=2839649 RepID=UPI001BE4D1A6|nr:urea ABC transporter permease subunit UrtB [Nonomuraea sp. NEAU-A123]MBT2234324.1 urea ABC transporter permease subunit UrtB [Nonomuraea sp. NEAU-A123]